MQFYSLNQQSPKVNFKEAVIRGIAPDKGLYFPSTISPINKEFFAQIDKYLNEDMLNYNGITIVPFVSRNKRHVFELFAERGIEKTRELLN